MKEKKLSVKELVQLTPQERLFAATFGTDFDEQACRFAWLWGGEIESRSKAGIAEALKPEGRELRDLFISKLEPKVTEAIIKGDGTWLRKLADAVERQKNPLDRVRHYIALEVVLLEGQEKFMPIDNLLHTASWWCEQIGEALGKKVDPILFRRWAKELGLRLKPDKVGPKHKN